MHTRTAALLLAAAFAAFAVWELIQHVFLMDLPMAVYHTVSLTIEFGIVFVIALVAMRLLREVKERHERQRALQETVLRTLAQDLRPPLVSLLAELQVLERAEQEGMDERVRDLLRQLSARAGVLVEMIEDLVSLEVEASRPDPCRRLSLDDLLAAVLPAQRAFAASRGVRLAEAVEGEAGAACMAPEQLADALSSLLDHAIRATPRGGAVRLTASRAVGRLSFAVTDGALPREAPGPLGEVEEGAAGAHLRRCQSLAEALGGEAWCEPREAGNICTFSVPVREPRQ